MDNNTPTPASVASRLTDDEILRCAHVEERYLDHKTAAVLRDYVRMRKLENAVKACVAKATLGTVVAPVVFKWDDSDKSWICYDAEGMCRLTTEVEESCINSMAEIKRLLAEAEKGEAK